MTDKTEHTADVIQIGFRIEKRKEKEKKIYLKETRHLRLK